MSHIDLSVVIVSFNTRGLLAECISSAMRECHGLTAEIIVVDNGSSDGSAAMVEAEFPDALLVRSNENLGFGRANNLGFQAAGGRYVVLLNSDAFMAPGTLSRALAYMDSTPRCGMLGARLVGRDGVDQPSARQFPSLFNDMLHLTGLSARFPHSPVLGAPDRTWADPTEPVETDWVPGAFAVIRRQALKEVGYFDERFFLYYEEVDLCRRLKDKGWTVAYRPELVVTHFGGESSKTVKRLTLSGAGSQLTLWRMRSALLYYRKHHGIAGALGARLLEGSWHGLRALKNALRRSPEARVKRDESKAILALLGCAWQETRGGRVSPPQPW